MTMVEGDATFCIIFERCMVQTLHESEAAAARTLHELAAIFRQSRFVKQNETSGDTLFHETCPAPSRDRRRKFVEAILIILCPSII